MPRGKRTGRSRNVRRATRRRASSGGSPQNKVGLSGPNRRTAAQHDVWLKSQYLTPQHALQFGGTPARRAKAVHGPRKPNRRR